jgi:hypothetical protein
MTGSTADRVRAAVLLGLIAALGLPAAASAAPTRTVVRAVREDLPDVHGLSVADTRKVLQSWNKGVVIIFEPDLKELPPGATESTVVASRATQVTSSAATAFGAVNGPRVLVTLGAVMPDLTGLHESDARAAMADQGLTLAADPAQPPADWTVSSQSAPAGSVVEFGAPVSVQFAAPEVVPPLPPPPRRLLPVSLPVAVAAGAGALLLIVLGTALVARSVRRRRRAKDQNQDRDQNRRPREHIQVHAFAGQVTGPDVFDLPGAPPVASAPPREGQS